MDETTPTSDSFPVGLKRSQIRKLSEHDFALYLFIYLFSAFEFLSSVTFLFFILIFISFCYFFGLFFFSQLHALFFGARGIIGSLETKLYTVNNKVPYTAYTVYPAPSNPEINTDVMSLYPVSHASSQRAASRN